MADKLKPRAIQALKKIRTDGAPYLTPSSPELIVRMLETVAQMFQVSLPEDEGLMLYTAILSELPEPLLTKAVTEVCKTHKFKTMPLPSEFLDAVKDEAWQWRWLDQLLTKFITQLEAA